MKPKIDSTSFGSIIVEGETFDYDILIRLDGRIEKREKKCSQKKNTGLPIKSLLKKQSIFMRKEHKKIIIGTGQTGFVELSEEAEDFFRGKRCGIELFPTPWAIERWNEIEGKVSAMFHVTC
ncbi:MTH938/NDUFAF3 family protein [Methanosarcina horonobensis]|uniref:MTH938/NDUFAF3 family protein n=1 Tax=Methanosarcina horonobensis TaxID=418008 RepID=UPI000A4DE8C8|nr:MTH938/NDUFAF3 family protein [Methanosarcina horonobensis]